MEEFKYSLLTLVALAMCFCITEAQITQWGGGTGTAPAAGATATLTQTVAEDLAVATAVLTVTATATGTKGSFTIATQPNAGQIDVDGASGVVALATGKSFDRETAETVVITITVTDTNSGTVTTGTATVTITVTDVNEFAPVFTKPSSTTGTADVADKSTASTAVYTVTATDADADTTEKIVTYSIVSGNTNTDFGISGSTGAITVANTLDKATTATYALVIRATDAGTDPGVKSSSVTVSVTVCDPCNGAGSASLSIITLMAALLMYMYQLM